MPQATNAPTPAERRAPQKLPTEALLFAKFPPDDADFDPSPPAGGGGAGAPGGFDPNVAEDGNFKRGRFPLIGILAAVVVVALGAFLLYMGLKTDEEQMTPEEVAATKKNIFVLPKEEQIPRWRQWAATNASHELQQEALIQLAFANDPEGVKLAIDAMAQPDKRVRGVAALVLAHYGLPAAEGAKGALMAALEEADESDRRQIVWALVALKEPAVFDTAMSEYRKGNLATVERLGGGSAFNPEVLADLVPLDKFAALAGDESESVRQLVATTLSRKADPKYTDTLIKLVKDSDPEVGREAAVGLGKIGDDKALAPLLEALKNADKDSRQKFLEALRDGVGGVGLVLALDSVSTEKEETTWFQTHQIFEMIRQVGDPRIGDAMLAWVENAKPKQHWRALAGTRMAEVGDVRAAPLLAERMLMDPLETYQEDKFWEHDAGGHLSRTDRPRVVAARMLADLAVMHPDKHEQLLEAAEDAVLIWATDKPQPHANALRFLATANSSEALPVMRDWAFPDEPLPKEGQQGEFPRAYETAQSALRYIGRMKDKESFPKLLDQLERKEDPKMDITQEGLMGAGLSMLGMALRAVGYGASQGLAEWGDPEATDELIEFIEDETWHEEARLAACEALAWCAPDDKMPEIAEKAIEFTADNAERKQIIGACYAVTLSLRPVEGSVPKLAEMIKPEVDFGVRIAIAQAIGMGGVDEATAKVLMEKLENPDLRSPAALALILGGNADIASRTVAMFADYGPESLNDLKDHYFRAFGYWSDEDFKSGNLYRFVENAIAISRVKIGKTPQVWARQRLERQFDNLQFDNGPHSETRVVLRYRLFEDAKQGADDRKRGAIMTLKFMKEQGVLMALRDEEGLTGDLAKQAFFELMNPAIGEAEDLSQLEAEQKAKQEQRGG